MRKVVAVSGGFDPIHVGHIRHFIAAKKLGTELVVLLDSDSFLIRKKGRAFMKWKDRAEIIRALGCVDRVIKVIDKPGTGVSKTLAKLRPAIFANGGDRKPSGHPVPEAATCRELGIELRYNVGGGKVRSSSNLLKTYEARK